MKKLKNAIIILIITALLAGGAYEGLSYMKKSNQKEVPVISVGSIASDYYSPSTSLDGTVTTSVSQRISMDDDMIVDQVYVQKGDSVKKGDQLVSFDMTLVEMELNIARLKRQLQIQQLNKAVNRLNSLQNGGPINDDDASPIDADNLGNTGGNEPGEDDLAYNSGAVNGQLLASIVRPMLLASLTDFGSEEQTDEAVQGEDTVPDIQYQDPAAGDFGSGEFDTPDNSFDSGNSDMSKPSPEPTPIPDEDTEYFDPTHPEEIPGISDGKITFYEQLDYDSIPYSGTGTKDDPYLFFCSSKEGKVMVMGSFFNKMAGYNEAGTEIKKEGGSWYLLEFYENDIIGDMENRKDTCIGYYLVDGSLLQQPVKTYTYMDMTVDGALRYDDGLPSDELPGPYDPNDGSMSTLTRAEAIKIQKNRIASLNLDIQESDIEISKLEKKLEKKMITAKIDGNVSYVGDSLTGSSDGDTFIRVKSKDGFYVKGTVSELLLDQVKEGTQLNCNSYENGAFTAEVIDVSEYPTSSDNGFWGDGNPNVSYYTYSASISDKSIKLSDMDWVTITLDSKVSAGNSIVLMKAFVRTENGTSYVYKDDNGILKKQIISVGGNVDGGYSVLIKGGLTREDKICFPYGKIVQEGAKTREGTTKEVLGY